MVFRSSSQRSATASQLMDGPGAGSVAVVIGYDGMRLLARRQLPGSTRPCPPRHHRSTVDGMERSTDKRTPPDGWAFEPAGKLQARCRGPLRTVVDVRFGLDSSTGALRLRVEWYSHRRQFEMVGPGPDRRPLTRPVWLDE